MTQRILIKSKGAEWLVSVQTAEHSVTSCVLPTMDAAWEWARTILQAHNHQIVGEEVEIVAEEIAWNGVL